MQLSTDDNGDILIDPDLLATRLSIPAAELRRRMRIGLVSSLVETGEGADAGRRRLTVRTGNRVWRAVVDAEARLLGEETLDLKPAAAD